MINCIALSSDSHGLIMQMEIVRLHHKLMQQIFSSRPVVEQDVDKEPSHAVRTKAILAILKCRASDEVATVSSIAAPGSGHGRHLSG